MVKFLIASHGYLADGFKSSISIIMGEEIANRITALNAFVGEASENSSVKVEIENYLNSVDENDQVIVFTDILHGSVNQMMMPFADDNRVFVITGCNFPLICEIMASYCYSDDSVQSENLTRIIETAKKELIYVNDFLKESVDSDSSDEESDFFE